VITSLAVGAVFTVEDRASPIIDRIAAQVERLDGLVKRTLVGMQALGEERFGGLSRSLAQVERRMGTIATSSERMSAAFVASTEAMVTGLAAATAQIGAMAAEMRSVAAATRLVAPGAAAAGGGGRGGGRGHGGLHAYAPLPGGVHARMGVGGAAALGIGVGAGMLVGIHGAAEEQLALRYALLAGGVNPDSAQGQQLYGQLRDTSLATSQRTIFSQAAVAKMMPGIIGMADVPIAQALPFMRPAIQFGEYERLMGKSMGQSWSAESSAAAAIRTSHLLGITDPGVMSGVMNMMVPATATAAPIIAAVRRMMPPICRRRPPSVLSTAISPACSAITAFIVAAIRNRADRNARIVMMYSSAMILVNAGCPGHWLTALVAGSEVIGSDPVCAVR